MGFGTPEQYGRPTFGLVDHLSDRPSEVVTNVSDRRGTLTTADHPSDSSGCWASRFGGTPPRVAGREGSVPPRGFRHTGNTVGTDVPVRCAHPGGGAHVPASSVPAFPTSLSPTSSGRRRRPCCHRRRHISRFLFAIHVPIVATLPVGRHRNGDVRGVRSNGGATDRRPGIDRPSPVRAVARGPSRDCRR